MAKPFQEGNGWAFRLRANGQDIYQSGFKSEAAARKEMAQLLADINNEGKSVGDGPFRTCVAVAFAQYAVSACPSLKAPQPTPCASIATCARSTYRLSNLNV